MLLLIMHDRECAQAHEHEVPDDDHLSAYPAPLRFPDPEGAHHDPRSDLGQQVVWSHGERRDRRRRRRAPATVVGFGI